MKRLVTCAMLSIFLLSACTKNPIPADPKEEPIPNPNGGSEETIPATADIYIIGEKYTGYQGSYALWAEGTIKESFTDYSLEGAGLESIFIQENSGKKTVHFFGSKSVSQNASRITYFNKKNYVTLSDKLNIPIISSWNEAFIAHTTFNKEAYLMAASTLTDLSDKRYYYKIDRAGNPTVHELLRNKAYEFIAVGSSGVFVSHYEAKLFWTDISVYRENNFLNTYRVELQDFSYLTPHDMVMVNDHIAGFICSARYDPTSITGYLYVTVDLNTKVVQSHRLGLPVDFHAGNLTVKGNIVLLYGYVNNDKTAYYYQIGYSTSGLFVIQKVPLEANGTSVYTTSDIYDSGASIYVSGNEDNNPVYWKDGKIVRMQVASSTKAILHDIRN
ncbi:hypothetical protein [Pedobacter sp. HMWF019]|uniref:hypothetical protein n=1 Tax=Pedobacter sp. HMWF019 TaxID=2056856 RepID=UPI0011B25941|nr:hypothetical protein [Pedobacter sp. HMWF019]